MEHRPPRWQVTFLLASIALAFALGGPLAQLAVPEAQADPTYQQRQTDALFERLVRAEEEQTRALQEIARQLGRK